MTRKATYSNEPTAVEKAAEILGHIGGLLGGPARAAKLSKERRSEIAREGGIASQRHTKRRRNDAK